MKTHLNTLSKAIDQLPPDEVVQSVEAEGAYVTMTKIGSGEKELVELALPNFTITTFMQDSPTEILKRRYAVDLDGSVWLEHEEAV